MKISYSWLKEYIATDFDAARIAQTLTSTGLEVEALEYVEPVPGGLEGVVVAEVLECTDHPDSDHLHVTKVDAGNGEILQVVCGAPNVAAGQKVFLAKIGSRLPAEDGSEFKIKKSKIRGVESFGMICAEDELGIGSSHDGIMVLDADAVPGTPAKTYLGLETDAVFEIGLTPNRIDAASHIGVARDLYAWLVSHGHQAEMTLPSVAAFRPGEGHGTEIEVQAPDGAPRYSGITLRGVKVGESPEWLKKHLLSVGLRPINNIVDVTNFVMLEAGLPMHAFDLAKVEGGKIVVRRAAEGEKFVTLDGVERTLSAEDLMICDAVRPMCLAGVFGGEFSGISESTTDVFLESAYFNPVSIRKSSKRHGIKTDASFRYERGVDPFLTDYAAKRAALLITEIAGGRIEGDIVRKFSSDIRKNTVALDFLRMESLIGKAIGADKIVEILQALEFRVLEKVYAIDGAFVGIVVEVPSYRVDVLRECDVVEEILRIYGYDNVDFPERVRISASSSSENRREHVSEAVSSLLSANGFREIMNNSLTKGDYYAGLSTFPEERSVGVLNPLSSDLNVMRQTLLFGGMEVIAHNINRQVVSMKLFEFGSVYSKKSPEIHGVQDIDEHKAFSLLITGATEKSWCAPSEKSGFFVLKGYLELILRRFGADSYSMDCLPAPEDLFSEGLEYSLRGEKVAVIGTVLPSVLKKFGIKQPVFAAEISFDALLTFARTNVIKYSPLPKFPEVRRDLALLVDEGVTFADMRRAAFRAGRKLLRQVTLFDVYRGDKIPGGKKQYALSFVLRDADKTLTDKEVEKFMENLVNVFEKEFAAQLR